MKKQRHESEWILSYQWSLRLHSGFMLPFLFAVVVDDVTEMARERVY